MLRRDKFTNGALTGAYVAMYNHMQHEQQKLDNNQDRADKMVDEKFGDFKYKDKVKVKAVNRSNGDCPASWSRNKDGTYTVKLYNEAFESDSELFYSIGHELTEIGLDIEGYNRLTCQHYAALRWEQSANSSYGITQVADWENRHNSNVIKQGNHYWDISKTFNLPNFNPFGK